MITNTSDVHQPWSALSFGKGRICIILTGLSLLNERPISTFNTGPSYIRPKPNTECLDRTRRWVPGETALEGNQKVEALLVILVGQSERHQLSNNRPCLLPPNPPWYSYSPSSFLLRILVDCASVFVLFVMWYWFLFGSDKSKHVLNWGVLVGVEVGWVHACCSIFVVARTTRNWKPSGREECKRWWLSAAW